MNRFSPTRFAHLRLGRRLLAGGTLVLILVSAAHADERRREAFIRPPGPGQERPTRHIPAFEMDTLRRQEFPEGREPSRRWTSEERRQLRRDVHEAGRDLYVDAPRP